MRAFPDRSDWSRTSGLHVPNVALYQLSYTPKCSAPSTGAKHILTNHRNSVKIILGKRNPQSRTIFTAPYMPASLPTEASLKTHSRVAWNA